METQTVTTAKRKVQVSTEKEVDFKIPSYYASHPHYYKVFSEKEAIQVYNSKYDNDAGIQVVHASTAFNLDNEEISEAEFLQAKEEVINRINQL